MLFSKHHSDTDFQVAFETALTTCMPLTGQNTILLCVGSDRHILDCFGPMVGTMLLEKNVLLPVYGTLNEPLHAKNLVTRMETINLRHPNSLHLAIDASLGTEEEIGFLRIRQGALLPGRALARRLPPIGHYAVTGVVGNRMDTNKRLHSGSLNHVYSMAKVLSHTIWQWAQKMA